MMNWEFQDVRARTTLRAEAAMEAAYKKAQIIWMALIGAAFAYVWVAERAAAGEHQISNLFIILIAAFAFWCLFGTLYFRRKFVTASEATLRADPGDAAARKKWMAGQVAALACAEVIVLYGLILRFTGANRIAAFVFYVVGIGNLIALRPKRIE